MSVELEDRAKALENEYFNRKERELIEKMKERLATENREASQMDCPRGDGGKLVPTDFEDIKIDVCQKCAGVWLDAGELAQIVHKQEDTWVSRLFGHYPDSK